MGEQEVYWLAQQLQRKPVAQQKRIRNLEIKQIESSKQLTIAKSSFYY
jgi:hypothetical protein